MISAGSNKERFSQSARPVTRVSPSATARLTCPRYFPAAADFQQGHTFPPPSLMQRGTGAKAIPDARRADGAPQQARTSPGHRAGKVHADAPRDTRRTGYSPINETIFALPKKGEYGGAGGVEGYSPLTPCPAPGRRPAARAGQQLQFGEEQNKRRNKKCSSHRAKPAITDRRKPLSPFSEHFQPEMHLIPNHTACRFAEKRCFPLTSGRAALCRRLRVSPLSKLKRSKTRPPLPAGHADGQSFQRNVPSSASRCPGPRADAPCRWGPRTAPAP